MSVQKSESVASIDVYWLTDSKTDAIETVKNADLEFIKSNMFRFEFCSDFAKKLNAKLNNKKS